MAFAYLANRGAISHGPGSAGINRMVSGYAHPCRRWRQGCAAGNRAQMSFASVSAKPM